MFPTPLAHVSVSSAGQGLVVAGVVAALVVGGWVVSRSSVRGVLLVAAGGLLFQVLHVLEHVLQLGYWVAHPLEAPWLTPWAVTGRDVLAMTVDGHAAGGNELLHLLGNLIFFGGLVALAAWRARTGRVAGRRALGWALGLQGFHVVEHLLLVATWTFTGQATGVTTLFGLLEAGTVPGDATRVLSHFALNAAATWVAVVAAAQSGLLGALRPTRIRQETAAGQIPSREPA